MDVSLIDMAGRAALDMADPARLGFLVLGVLIGLALGVIPGLGGLIGLSLLLPFTYGMDPMTGLAMLIGLAAVTTTSDGTTATLTIHDEGIGFPEADTTPLRGRFTRGTNATGVVGSGLGLTIADEVARAHGGHLAMSNNEGGPGACVSLSFPLR